MIQEWKRLGVILAVVGAIATQSKCAAQSITLDGSLGLATTLTGPNYQIRQADGQTVGNNLFHSFGRFNLNAGEVANFQSASNITNILSRVTGGFPSSIDGLISTSNRSVNLFLINPSGIIFGPNARLDVGGATRGSFVATTVDALVWANGSKFSATNPSGASSLLTIVGDPSGFLATVKPPQPLTLSGSKLSIADGQSLLFVGGNLQLDGVIQATGGQVELASLAGTGTVGLGVNGNILSLNIPDLALADVSLLNQAKIDVTAGNGGSITINARNLDILEGSQLRAGIGSGLGTVNSQAGDITLNATGTFKINQLSEVANVVNTEANGKAGNINVNAKNVEITGGGRLLTRTLGNGDAGNIQIKASGDITVINPPYTRPNYDPALDDKPALDASNYIRDSQSDSVNGKGRNGKISLFANGSISLTGLGDDPENKVISIYTVYGGKGGGDISLFANGSIFLNNANILASSFTGDAQNISLQGNESVSIVNNSALRTTNFAQGNSGKITIQSTGPISLQSSVVSTQIGSSDLNFTPAQGNAGDIKIVGRSLSVTDGASVTAKSNNSGNPGNIQVDAKDFVELDGRGLTPKPNTSRLEDPIYSSLTTTSDGPLAKGPSGNINITTGTLGVLNGTNITTETKSDFNGGNITVNAKVVELTGGGQLLSTASGKGNAGNITLNVTNKIVIDGSNPSFENLRQQIVENGEDFQTRLSSAGPNSGLFASTASGEGGNITIQGQALLLLRHNSQISTSAGITQPGGGNGGNITINTPLIVAVPGENSDITADAFSGSGGNIQINSLRVFGIEKRSQDDLARLLKNSDINQLKPENSLTNDITAFSQTNLSGQVTINTPDIDPSRGLVVLPTVVLNTPRLVATSCAAFADKGGSSFTVTGRGGLPPSPDQPLSNDVVWSDTRVPNIGNGENKRASTTNTQKKPQKNSTGDRITIVPATGWVFNGKGQVTLISSAPSATIGSTPATCPKR